MVFLFAFIKPIKNVIAWRKGGVQLFYFYYALIRGF